MMKVFKMNLYRNKYNSIKLLIIMIKKSIYLKLEYNI